ncbi:MAG TPA: copper chaperone PCu(A)C [Novosphingobium sp.]|nr:copper chaperone PCu(A)C [Novosphingobium sp.]
MKRAPLAALPMLLMAACHQSPSAPAEAPSGTPSPEAAAAEAVTAQPAKGLAIMDGRLVLPMMAGHPGAAYFTLANPADATPVAITSVAIAGAKSAEMHETKGGEMAPLPRAEVAPGASLAFAPGGRHVMVFGLPDTVKAGDTVDITLTTDKGATIAGKLKAEPMGGGDMDHMKM